MNQEQVQNRVAYLVENGYELDLGKHITKSFDIIKKHWGIFALYSVVMIFLVMAAACTIIGLFIVPHLTWGYTHVTHKINKGEEFTFSDFFDGFNYFFPLLKTSLLHGLAILVAAIPLIIGYGGLIYQAILEKEHGSGSGNPAVALASMGMLIIGVFISIPLIYYVSTKTFFAPYLTVYGGYGARESIRISWQLSKHKFWYLFLLLFVAGAIAQLGVIACYIGLFVTMPIQAIIPADFVQKLFFGEEGATPAEKADLTDAFR